MKSAEAELELRIAKDTQAFAEEEIMSKDFQSPSTVAICVNIDQSHFHDLQEAYGDKMFRCYWKVSYIWHKHGSHLLPEQRHLDIWDS